MIVIKWQPNGEKNIEGLIEQSNQSWKITKYIYLHVFKFI